MKNNGESNAPVQPQHIAAEQVANSVDVAELHFVVVQRLARVLTLVLQLQYWIWKHIFQPSNKITVFHSQPCQDQGLSFDVVDEGYTASIPVLKI